MSIISTPTHPQMISYQARRTDRIMVLDAWNSRCDVICRNSNWRRRLCWFGFGGSMVLSEPGRVILLISKHRQVDYMLLYDLSSANENGLSRLLKLAFLLDEADTQTNNIANDSRVDVDLHSNRQLHL